MEYLYLAGALATGVMLMFDPKFSRESLEENTVAARGKSDRFIFSAVSTVLLFLALLWPAYWLWTLVRAFFRDR